MGRYDVALPARRSSVTPYGTRARLTAASGDVEGYLTLAGFDRRTGTAGYALRIVNQSAQPMRARMTCARLRGAPVLGYPLDVDIAPFSVAETLLPVRVADVGPYDRAIVKVIGSNVAFSLEAPAPPPMRRRRWIVPSLAAAMVLAGALGAGSMSPRLPLLAAPKSVAAGSALDVPYAFGGFAAMRYTLQTPDGRQLAAGITPDHEGTMHFAKPWAAGNSVVLTVTVAGPFGSTSASRRIRIAPARTVARLAPATVKPVAIAPRISDLSIGSPIVRAGAALQVRYVTDAAAGQVWLVDPAGKLWSSAALWPDGISVLKVPSNAGGRQMRVVLHAHGAGGDTVSSVGVVVLPSAIDTAATASGPSPQPAAGLAFDLSTRTAVPGQDVVATLNGPHGDARVSLNDAAGNSVEEGDVPSDQSAVTLSAPSVTQTTTYYVVANISSGIGEQSIVRTLVVSPRP